MQLRHLQNCKGALTYAASYSNPSAVLYLSLTLPAKCMVHLTRPLRSPHAAVLRMPGALRVIRKCGWVMQKCGWVMQVEPFPQHLS